MTLKILPECCGACRFAVFDQEAKKHNVTAEQYLCHGNPPTAQMVPIQGAGGAQYVGMAVRAPVKAEDLACHLFEPRPVKLAS